MIEPTAIINLRALEHNFSVVKHLAPKAKIIAMVKSNAYGHGLLQVAHTLKQADAFGVARLREALHLREAAVTQDIVLMPGFLRADQLPIISVNNIQAVVHNSEQVSMLEQVDLANPINVWLKVDTGMGRLGFNLDQAVIMDQRLHNCKNVDCVRYMTHFASVDDIDHATNKLQFQRLAAAQQKLSGDWTAAKSAAVVAFDETQFQWVRPGIMLYGVTPVGHQSTQECNLQPVMTLQAPIISVRTLAKGEPVGYGSTYVCPETMPVAVVGIGYGDGYPRHAAQGTPVLVNGQLAPRIGRVCMDMFMIDLRGIDNVKIGDVVTLWGEGLPAEIVASHAETIAYELFCSVTKRVKYEYQR